MADGDSDLQQTMRRTRFVCLSDTHNASPNGSFRLPKGDVLIHAGDLTNQGSISEIQKAIQWIEEADFEVKIVIAGNHDITLDSEFYSQYGLYFHNQNPQNPAACQKVVENASTITWLRHEAKVIHLQAAGGPRTKFKIFGSPLSPAKGMWAFGYEPDEATHIWDNIPLDTDIVLTHTPPKYHCDESKERRAAGCESLRQALWRVRPRLAICGHVHEGRGGERVCWDLSASNIKYKEDGVERWIDPGQGNNKMSLVDLSAKKGKPLENDGSVGDCIDDDVLADIRSSTDPSVTKLVTSVKSQVKITANLGISRIGTQLLAVPAGSDPPATRGQGGSSPSRRCDVPALAGRLGRKETFIINAALMASSWPHRQGGKKFNKPIVVDIDLPSWETD